LGGTGGTTVVVTNSNSQGFYILNRTSSTLFKVFKSGTTLGTNTVLNNGTYPNRNVFISALNLNGTASFFASRQIAFFSIGDGLTDTEADDFNTSVQTFQTTLSRNI
jgi:hypothetical protein